MLFSLLLSLYSILGFRFTIQAKVLSSESIKECIDGLNFVVTVTRSPEDEEKVIDENSNRTFMEVPIL